MIQLTQNHLTKFTLYTEQDYYNGAYTGIFLCSTDINTKQ